MLHYRMGDTALWNGWYCVMEWVILRYITMLRYRMGGTALYTTYLKSPETKTHIGATGELGRPMYGIHAGEIRRVVKGVVVAVDGATDGSKVVGTVDRGWGVTCSGRCALKGVVRGCRQRGSCSCRWRH